jgi:outer membrane protein
LFKFKSANNNSDIKTNNTQTTISNNSINNTSSLSDGKIAFVNIDTINEKYLYISDIVKQMKARKEKIEAQLQSMMTQFQQDYEAFQQSVQAGIAPPSELEKQKRKLEQQQRDIQNKQLQMDNLAAELQEKNEQLQKDMKEFMNRFNNGRYDYILSYSEALPNVLFANPKYDITNEVIKALNEEYIQKSKQNKQ